MKDKLVLVINSGSSSLKFAIIDTTTEETLLSGLAEKLGLETPLISWKCQGQKHEENLSGHNDHYEQAMEKIVMLTDQYHYTASLVAVGHRIVHGGIKFTKTTKITPEVITEIRALADLAPLHNEASAKGIEAAVSAFPVLPQFAVFDTAFHQTMPAKAYTGAISKELFEKYSIRRYGFHGTSHYYVSRQAAKIINKPIEQCSFISVHLGNGASVCAINNGQSVDTSMGFTPLAGLMMGTRSGDLDPGIIEFLLRKGWTSEAVFETLNKKSGFLGISGISSDAREILEAMQQGHQGAKLAFEVFTYRVAKYIGSYLIPLDRLDAIIFTGGIGENAYLIRKEIIKNLHMLGFVENDQANQDAKLGKEGQIAYSEIFDASIFVIPTNEEFVIAQQSVELI